jgi:hypothetical protein
MTLKLVDNVIPLPAPDDVKDVLDAFTGMVGRSEITKAIVFYECPDTTTGWLSSEFDSAIEQFGMIEFIRLTMHHAFSHEGGE